MKIKILIVNGIERELMGRQKIRYRQILRQLMFVEITVYGSRLHQANSDR